MIEFNFKLLIHSVLIIQCALFALQLFSYRNISSSASRILGVLMICLFVFFSSSFPFTAKIFSLAYYTQYIMMLVFLLLNPLYYLYVLQLTVPDFKYSKSFNIHFLPALVFTVLNIVFYSLLPHSDKILFVSGNVDDWRNVSIVIKINSLIYVLTLLVYYLQLLIYVLKMIRLIRYHSKNIEHYFSTNKYVSLNWLKVFIVILTVNAFLEITISLAYYYNFFAMVERAYYVVLFFMINFLGFFGIKQSDIYAGSIQRRLQVAVGVNNKSGLLQDIDIANVPFELSEEEQQNIISKLNDLMEVERVFTNHLLSIYDVAEILHTNKTYVSIAINKVLKKNFRSYINEFRIKEAMKLLSEAENNKYSIEGISQMAGYSSKSTFNNVFKKHTGMLPSDYRNKYLQDRN